MVVERFNSKTFAVSCGMALVILTATTTAQAAKLADYDLLGTCTFTSPWTGPSCMEFRSEGADGWDTTTMTARCATETESTLVMMDVDDTMGCSATTSSELAGWCVLAVGNEDTSSMVEASPMMISAMGECDGNKMACETFVGGTWEAAANCETDADSDSSVDDTITITRLNLPTITVTVIVTVKVTVTMQLQYPNGIYPIPDPPQWWHMSVKQLPLNGTQVIMSISILQWIVVQRVPFMSVIQLPQHIPSPKLMGVLRGPRCFSLVILGMVPIVK